MLPCPCGGQGNVPRLKLRVRDLGDAHATYFPWFSWYQSPILPLWRAGQADWERYADGRPKFIKRGDLSPEAKRWFELVRRSILPAANNSEGGEINVHELIAEGIQDSAEKADSGARLWYPSTILRLCNKAKVVFEDSNPDWVNPGRPVTLERLVYTTPAQQQRRPHIGKQKAKEGTHQEEYH
ncbi:hypothetical protein Ahy_A10g049365 [Arachis hypogaea]|uniref:Uncharacterized protein n=1 Tax=Arachis hypogaea TaxID=3818 RepID=A0A445B709_ARAHY|nr:hypothetical protein Ahy_A10g049365 [Arachis hypogaea]